MLTYVLTFFATIAGVAAGNLVVPFLKNKLFGSDTPAPRTGVFSSVDRTPCSEYEIGRNVLQCLGNIKKDEVKSFADSLKELEEKRNTKIVFISHPYTTSYFSRGLAMDDADALADIVRRNPDSDLDIVIDTPGGSLAAAEVMVNMLSSHQGEVNVFIPRHAASAGTLIALSADNIYLGNNAFMGPIDPQYTCFSAKSVAKYASRYTSNERMSIVSDMMQFISTDANAAITRVTNVVRTLWASRGKEAADGVVELLINGDTQHDQPLFRRSLGCINTLSEKDVPAEIYDIFDQYQKTSPPQRSPLSSILGGM